MATPNPILQQIIKNISSRANQGRVTLDWGTLTEGRKRKVREAVAPKADPVDDELPDLDPNPRDDSTPDEKPTPEGDAPKVPEVPPADDAEQSPEPPASGEEPEGGVDKAKEDAEKAKAELEKAKSEKDQAEQELEQNEYIKLNTPPGVSFLLGKLVGHAFQTNTMDALAGEFVNKLKITNPEDFQLFSSDMIPYKNISGMVEFLDSVKSLSASGKQEPTED